MRTVGIYFKMIILGALIISFSSSCSLTLPRFSKNTTGVTLNNNAAEIEALSKEDYTVLRKTTGKATTSRWYILFIPIGKHKSNNEVYDNAYYNAIDNLPDADGLILPRKKTKKFTIPLILINYNRRSTTVTGVGISVNEKAMENSEVDIPYTIATDYRLKRNAKVKRLRTVKITTQNEFDKYFEKAKTGDGNTTDIDFSKQYVIAEVGKATKKYHAYNVNYLRLKDQRIKLSRDLEEGEKETRARQPILIVVVDKKYQGEVIVN